jgi:hypothetical protein
MAASPKTSGPLRRVALRSDALRCEVKRRGDVVGAPRAMRVAVERWPADKVHLASDLQGCASKIGGRAQIFSVRYRIPEKNRYDIPVQKYQPKTTCASNLQTMQALCKFMQALCKFMQD